MKKTRNWIRGLTGTLAAILLASAVHAAPLRLFAAASLQGPLDEITNDFPLGATTSYGGSGTIARQISLGAPADAVILASAEWADWLVDQGHAQGPARTLFSNRLVLVTPPGGPVFDRLDAAILAQALGADGRLAMGQHMSVPAGIYAQAWLAHIGAWDSLRARLAETENVRAALAIVARGEVPLGIVYASDARAAGAQVSLAYAVPADQHPPILYVGLALTPAGADFLDHLSAHVSVFEAAGFVALP